MTLRLLSLLVSTAAVALLASASVSPPVSAQEGSPRTVLGVYWSSEDFPTNPLVDSGIREALRSRPEMPIDYFAEYVESDRFPEEDASLALRDYMRRKYSGRRIDAVLAISDVALDFVLRHRADLFPDAPVVYSGTTMAEAGIRSGAGGVTGVLTGEGFVETLELALGLHPATERVFVVAEAPNGRLLGSVQAVLRALERREEISYIIEKSLPDLLAAIKAVPARSLVLLVRYSQEDPGRILFPSDVAPLVAAASPVPVYGVSETYIGSGIVGGVVYETRRLGIRLGEIALQVLDGRRAQDIAMARVPLVPVLDWRQVQRWGIDASLLPPASVIQFRVPTILELYGWYILAALALLALQGMMIVALVVQRSRRREVEARNSAILRAMPDMMFLLSRDGVYIDYHAPDNSRRLPTPDHFLGRHMRDVLPHAVAAAFEDCFARVAPRQPPAMLEYALQTSDGERYYEARIAPCRDDQVLAVVQDITERKCAEAALSDSKQRYARATAAGGVGVWDWDLETNEIYVDPLLKAILGYQDHEIRNHIESWSRLVHPDDVPAVMARAEDHLGGRTAQYEVEHRMVHKDGSIRWFLARGSAVRRDGRAVRVVGTDTDITERKKAEQALHEAQADLTRVSRLTALGEFAASIAHEVRQPLTAIITNASTCLRWLGSPVPDMGEARAALLDVVEAGRQADDMIRRHRELFKHNTVEKAALDISTVIAQATLLARARLQASHVTLTVSQAVDVPTVAGDRVGLQQVLLNLIGNSIDAMESVDPRLRRIDVSTSLANGMVAISVTDTGIGLAGVDLQRMFALSYTTKATGTGVGLSISRSIVEAHGGQLWAEQTADRGATFCFTVPVHPTFVAA